MVRRLEPFFTAFCFLLLFSLFYIQKALNTNTRKLFWGKVENENETENQQEKNTQFVYELKLKTHSRIEWGVCKCVIMDVCVCVGEELEESLYKTNNKGSDSNNSSRRWRQQRH